jgi:hypothetical protein
MIGLHCNHYYDGDNAAAHYQKEPHVLHRGHEAVTEYDKETAAPIDDEERDIDVPRLHDVVGVEDRVHLDSDVGGNGDNRGEVEYPSEEVQRSGEEPQSAPEAGTGSYGCPMID